MKKEIIKKRGYWIINNRYLVYKDGVIYDSWRGEDIPQTIFKWRDELLKNLKVGLY